MVAPMVVLDPERVTLNEVELTGVRTIMIDRTAERLLEEWSDGSSVCAFVDVARQRVTVRVVRLLGPEAYGAPAEVSDQASLVFTIAPNRSGAGGQRVAVAAVVVGVTHEFVSGEVTTKAKPGVLQTIELRGVSLGGGTDPVLVNADEGV